MPRLALAIFVVWFLVLFVFRSLWQWHETGSTGFKGFDGPVGSLRWWAGVLVALGLVLSPLAPVATLLGWPAGALLLSNDPVHLAGGVLAALGTLGALAAQIAMGASWRVGVDESETTELVTRGPFAWVRNPIFTFMFVTSAGLLLLLPSAWSLAAAVLTVVGIELQVRAVEEPYLRRAHGDAYRSYAAEVGRFLPRVGRLPEV